MTVLQEEQRRVLLIDANGVRRNLRTDALRSWEIEVDPTDRIAEGIQLLRMNSYQLVLLAAQANSPEATALCEALRVVRPKQRAALLIGAPEYLQEIGRVRKSAEGPASLDGGKSTSTLVSPYPTQWQHMMDRLIANG
jgi:response regulator RpfG family c-di-GMP phosphodiesterase